MGWGRWDQNYRKEVCKANHVRTLKIAHTPFFPGEKVLYPEQQYPILSVPQATLSSVVDRDIPGDAGEASSGLCWASGPLYGPP